MTPTRRRLLLAATAAVGAAAPSWLRAQATGAAMQAVLDYVQNQQTTGFLIVRGGKTMVERNWPLPADAAQFRRTMAYETTPDGALLEDVASQQKSFVSFLVAVAVDKGLLDVGKPVSAYIGPGWSKASPDQEARIRVLDVLNQSSGLTEQFTYAAPPGTTFFYNTPVYAITKKVLAAAAHQPLETLTRDWLTGPAGLANTSWRPRPAAMADVGNPTGLVTSPRDAAKFGQIILDGGGAADGRRLVSEAGLGSMFIRSATNPAYGRLWWLNGSTYTIRPLSRRVDGPLVPSAPADLVAALGALDRKIYVVPSLLRARTGAVRCGRALGRGLSLLRLEGCGRHLRRICRRLLCSGNLGRGLDLRVGLRSACGGCVRRLLGGGRRIHRRRVGGSLGRGRLVVAVHHDDHADDDRDHDRTEHQPDGPVRLLLFMDERHCTLRTPWLSH